MREVIHVALNAIHPGHNPRKFFPPESEAELTDSVRTHGVLQPIIVKTNGEGTYVLVAGERRYRAAKACELETIPAVLLRDEENDEAVSLIENTQRADMSPAEECMAVVSLIQKVKDREEVRGLLAWSKTKFARRLALGMAHPDVLQALTERKILLGHAELLAVVPKDKQQSVLKKVMDHSVSVQDLKRSLGAYTMELAKAPFDKTECAKCRFNTGNQPTLFEECLESGHCTNPPCYEGKVQQFIKTQKEILEGEYPRVEIVQVGEESYSLLDPDLVGKEQFTTGCKSCANFGCAIHTAPGHEGEAEGPVCFDTPCMVRKIAEYKDTFQSQSEVGTENDAEDEESLAGCSSDSGCAAPRTSAGASTSSLRPAIVEYRRKIWRNAISKFCKENGELLLPTLFFLLSGRKMPDVTKLNAITKKLGCADDQDRINWSKEKIASGGQNEIVLALVASIVSDLTDHSTQELLHTLGVDLTRYWSMNEEYLALLTKKEIESLLETHGFPEDFKVSSLKKAEIPAKVMAVDFDWSGKLPSYF